MGRATARRFARHGASLCLLARNPERLNETKLEAERLGARAIAVSADVADPARIEAAAARAEEELGPINVWINNAMVSVFAPVKEMTAEEFRRVTEVTYSATSTGRSRRCAGCSRGITVPSCRSAPPWPIAASPSNRPIAPRSSPSADSPIRFHQPEVAADAIFHAARHNRREWVAGFFALKAIAGSKIIPGLLDKYLATAAYDGQQTGEPEDAGRPDNLWEPVPGNFSAHGRFDRQARQWSPQFAMSRRRKLSMLFAGAAGIACAALLFRGRG